MIGPWTWVLPLLLLKSSISPFKTPFFLFLLILLPATSTCTGARAACWRQSNWKYKRVNGNVNYELSEEKTWQEVTGGILPIFFFIKPMYGYSILLIWRWQSVMTDVKSSISRGLKFKVQPWIGLLLITMYLFPL